MTVDHRPRGLAESGGGGGVGGLGLRNCSALNRHVHYHCCVIDGVFEPVEKADDVPQAVRFRAAADLTPEAVATIAEQVRVRVLRWFARSGLDGDGPWRCYLEPPDSVAAALAGYVWSGLGSPVVAERWQHAHVVRSAIELGWTELVDALIARAESGRAGPFADQGARILCVACPPMSADWACARRHGEPADLATLCDSAPELSSRTPCTHSGACRSDTPDVG